MSTEHPHRNSLTMHPKGTHAKVLLTGVFGPYAQNDEYGSRKTALMELFHTQITREQGIFSIRLFHPSFGLKLIKENIDAPCALLDYPSLKCFIAEIKRNAYDVIGISGIVPNVKKVKTMCELIRKHAPHSTIVVGGHVTSIDTIHTLIDADHIVRGDGVSWFRSFLGQDTHAPIQHPYMYSSFGARIFGFPIQKRMQAAALIPSVGCPIGCNFCATSSFFGGKGKFINFYETGDELFSIMCQIEKKLKTNVFFIIDENFLLYQERALRLLELMKRYQKSWSFHVFSSAHAVKLYSIDELIRLGISAIWVGLEGQNSQYEKLYATDTHRLVTLLQQHGISVIGSSIIGLENHTPENIDQVIDWAVSHDTVFHQFFLYLPQPGTPLYQKYLLEGRSLSQEECDFAEYHGQNIFTFRHPHIPNGTETQQLIASFQKDFEINGPSIFRLIRTTFYGWKRYKDHPDLRIRNRYRWEIKSVGLIYWGTLFAMKIWYKKNDHILKKITHVLHDFRIEFRWPTRILAFLLSKPIYLCMKIEAYRLRKGRRYEPPTLYEKIEFRRRHT